jgi:hypothetical protein
MNGGLRLTARGERVVGFLFLAVLVAALAVAAHLVGPS